MTWLSAFEPLGSELSSCAAHERRPLPVWCGYGGFRSRGLSGPFLIVIHDPYGDLETDLISADKRYRVERFFALVAFSWNRDKAKPSA